MEASQSPFRTGIEDAVVLDNPPPDGVELDEQLQQGLVARSREMASAILRPASTASDQADAPGSSLRVELLVNGLISSPEANSPSPAVLEVSAEGCVRSRLLLLRLPIALSS